jgi:hypothetical protein
MVNVTLNAWSKLPYFDPEPVLKKLRRVEAELVPLIPDRDVRELRTHGLKSEREARDAAIFAYGMGKSMNTKVLVARDESADHDFLTCWKSDDELHYCPVQLKELPPEHRNRDITLRSLLAGLPKVPGPRTTVLAIKVNRRGRFDLPQLDPASTSFREVWFFGATSLDQSEWFLFGDVLGSPGMCNFAYPA